MTELYAVRMDVAPPPDMDPAARDDLLGREEAYAQGWQRSGRAGEAGVSSGFGYLRS